ncbi:MAG: HEAT repeat domain-containing protein [Verrucomicrobiota bacterium]
MERILKVIAGVGLGVMLVLGARISGRLEAMRSQLERQTELLSTAREAERNSGADTAGAEASPLAERMERVAEALEALVVEDETRAGKSLISSQSMEDAALMLSYSPDPRLRQQTIVILGQLGGEKAEKRLLEILESDSDSQSQVLQALQSMGSAHLESLVMNILKDGTLQEKNVAVGVLNFVLNRENLPDVLEVLDQLPTGNQSYGNSIRQRIYGAVRNLGDPAACRPLSEAVLMETNEYAQREAVQALVACSTQAHIGMLIEVLKALGPALQNHSSSSHQQLISHFGQLGDPRVTPVLLDFLDSPNRSVVQQAAQALMQLKDPLAVERFVKIANGADSHAKQYMLHAIRNEYPGIRKLEDGTFAVADEETMNQLLEARRNLVARIEKRYGPLEPESEGEEELDEELEEE